MGRPPTSLPTATELATLATFFSTDANAIQLGTRWRTTSTAPVTRRRCRTPRSRPDLITSYVVRAPVAGKQARPRQSGGMWDQLFASWRRRRRLGLNALMAAGQPGLGEHAVLGGVPQVRHDLHDRNARGRRLPAADPYQRASPDHDARDDGDLELGHTVNHRHRPRRLQPEPGGRHGHNRYAIEAYYGNNPNVRTRRAGVSVAAGGKLPMYVNLGTTTSWRHHDTVLPGSGGQSVHRQHPSAQLLGHRRRQQWSDRVITIDPPSPDGTGSLAQCNWFRDVDGVEIPLAAAGTSASITARETAPSTT